MDHQTLVGALMDPGFYAHPVNGVQYLQTHISSVFLTGDFAYKLKKPVDFGFLDFTTPEKRRINCEAEVELNRRLAPAVYLRVAPICLVDGKPVLDGPGDAIDSLVVMRQMDNDRLGPEVLARGELDELKIDSLVEVLAPFYEAARTGEGINKYGTIESVKFNTDENFAQTEGFVGTAISRQQFEEIRDCTNGFFKANTDLFERRINQGRIRESHGDLHLGNVFFEPGRPVIFDCIEFNERFRCGDVAVDLAFLAMDLDFQGRPELARRFVDGYIERSGDTELRLLLDFYCTYRAYVRGKIACFTSSDPALESEAKEQYLQLASRYFSLAHGYATKIGS